MSIGSNIKHFRLEANMTLDEVAQRIGISRQTMSRYETGVIANIPSDKLEAIAAVFNIHPALLMDWSVDWPDDIYEDYHNARNDAERRMILRENGIPADLKKEARLLLPSNRAFPLVGDIACGTPILAEENITEYVQFPGDLNADFCLRCRGDSMIDARILDGDIVFIRLQSEVENGEIAAVLIGEETTLKRVYHTGDTLTLMAANAAYAPMVYTGDQLTAVRILGKAVSFLSSVK